MNFASDNWAGAAEPVADALHAVAGAAPAYGGDLLTQSVGESFSRLFEREVAVFFVATGTAANSLALAAFARPGGVVLCHAGAHIFTDEGGAPDFLAGLRPVGLPGVDGKIAPGTLRAAIAGYAPGFVHHGQPAAVSVSQLTEMGAAYRPAEIAALAAVAKERGLAVHIDGARFANAVASTGASPAELTWKAGADVMSFGATKGGCWCAEAVIFFDPAAAAEFGFIRKRSGHLISKSRFVAAQFEAWLADGVWLRLAGHANAMAGRLAAGILAAGGRLAAEPGGNELFAIIPRRRMELLTAAGAKFYEWATDSVPAERRPGEGEALIRLVASFRTTADEIDRFLDILANGQRADQD